MIPVLGALILQAMYGAVDLLVVSQFGSNEGISASFLVRVPLSYIFSLKENASLVDIGIAIPLASIYGIIFFTIFYIAHIRACKKSASEN